MDNYSIYVAILAVANLAELIAFLLQATGA